MPASPEPGRGSAAGPLPLVVLGAATCEDTAIVRSRLLALGIPFRDVDIDQDPAAARRVLDLNGGHRITPTVIAGDDRSAVAEPTLERLGELLLADGHAVEAPRATEYHGELTTRPIPIRTLPTVDGAPFSLEQLRGRRGVALFLGHGPDCLACFGYARQLAGRRTEFAEHEAVPLIVVAGDAEAAVGSWRHGIASDVAILADEDGAWKRAVATHVGVPAGDAILLVLDRSAAPLAGSSAPEAGGLANPSTLVASSEGHAG